MDKSFQPSKFEEQIYSSWEKSGFFEAKVDKNKQPFSIILPPPNANADLHLGHAMYVYEDVMIRYHMLKGFETLWLPGADHAGFETQFVFEKQLQKEGKSRFDFDRETLYKMIWDFVERNRGNMESQLRRLGFALDWSKKKFTLDEDIVAIVYKTFKRLHDEGLVYREKRLVNYCVRDGTSFSDLEVQYVERTSPLYYIKYGPFTLATTRPETKFGDTAVAVNPNDKRYKKYIGKEIEVEGLIGKFKLKVIADDFVDPKFGTGVVKVTPAHDFTDFEVGQRHKLTMKQVISYDGKLNENAGKYEGLFVTKARKIIVEDLKKVGLLEKVKEDYVHRIGVCYKCGTTIEPLPLEQWYVKIRPLADEAKKLVVKDQINVIPKRFKKVMLQWLENFHDWNISRQLVWGIRIPAWRCQRKENKHMGFHESVVPQVFKGKTKTYRIIDHHFKVGDRVPFENSQKKELFGYGTITGVEETTVGEINIQDKTHFITYSSYEELIGAIKKYFPEKHIDKKTKAYLYEYKFEGFDKEQGCGRWIVTTGEEPEKCDNCGSSELKQDEDTFDTWFSSSQWPFATLQAQPDKDLFDYFYPTSVMETGYDILPWWVARMSMVGYFATKKVPFKVVFLHGLIRDKKGQKMSKSKGNVVNPMEMVEKYGADALRAALIFGTKEGNDLSFAEEKVIGMRNFTNKIWNIGRFIQMNSQTKGEKGKSNETLKKLDKESAEVKKSYLAYMDEYKFSKALEAVYEFLWHRFADFYIEKLKNELKNGNIEVLERLLKVYRQTLIMLHPFMPFVTEAVWQTFEGQKSSILKEKL